MHIFVLTVMLCLRTYLSIKLADINGGIVKTIVSRDFPSFVKRCLFFILIEIKILSILIISEI